MLLLNITTKISRSGKEVPQHGVSDLKASKDEYIFAEFLNELEEMGKIERTTFQADKIVLIPKLDGQIKKGRDSTYTPDFEFFAVLDKEVGEYQRYIIEVKGYSGAGAVAGYNNMRHKLADIHYSKTDAIYCVLKGLGKVKEGTKGFYDMYDRGIGRRNDKSNLSKEMFFNKYGIN